MTVLLALSALAAPPSAESEWAASAPAGWPKDVPIPAGADVATGRCTTNLSQCEIFWPLDRPLADWTARYATRLPDWGLSSGDDDAMFSKDLRRVVLVRVPGAGPPSAKLLVIGPLPTTLPSNWPKDVPVPPGSCTIGSVLEPPPWTLLVNWKCSTRDGEVMAAYYQALFDWDPGQFETFGRAPAWVKNDRLVVLNVLPMLVGEGSAVTVSIADHYSTSSLASHYSPIY